MQIYFQSLIEFYLTAYLVTNKIPTSSESCSAGSDKQLLCLRNFRF